MNGNYNKFRRLLEELFQLDHADLDFGIYRIMNQKRDEIMRFLGDDLLPQVQEAFQEYQGGDRANIEAQLNETIQQIKSYGMDPETSSKVQELREQLSQAVDVTKLENEVFSDLYDFFRRYYSEGDFLSLRRYKEGVYAIPYEGEEVKLHWANHDQYYVKTSEYFRDYTFKLPSGKYAHFKLVEADTEKDNQKAEAGKERRFILCEEAPLVEVDGDLHIRFEYRPDTGKTKQDTLNSAAFGAIMNTSGFGGWKAELAQPMPTESNPNRTLLEKRLSDYTARNTFDYFIHKDLGGFLRRELDFYIKNEIMHLDDIENESVPRVEQYLSKIKVIRKIAHKIIQFLAQIEDFQKKLWLKKKFVVETNYCVTLDRVPEELYPEIVANDAQREEWIKLFAIDEINGDLSTPGYSVPLTEDFLRANPFLVLDTRFFDEGFKSDLLSSFDDLEEETNGLLIQGENFQTLNILRKRYQEEVKCIYIDPPYNIGGDGFLYKDNYQHSSWVSMIVDRAAVACRIMSTDGVLFSSIDDNELANLRLSLDLALSRQAFVADLCVVNNLKGRSDKEHIAQANERLLIYKSPSFQELGFRLTDEQRKEYSLHDEDGNPYRLLGLRKRGGADTRELRPNLFFPIYIDPASGRISLDKSENYFIEVVPMKSDGTDGAWRWGANSVDERKEELIGVQKTTGEWDVFQIDPLFRGGDEKRFKPKSVWFGTDYSTDRATKELRKMLPGTEFKNPKPVPMMEDIVVYSSKSFDTILDYFAGSGTTGHAVINLNREDKGGRKYILVEMGDYFDTVLLPRIKKAICSKDWKNGKPVSREGVSHILKYIRMESYEDTLNNLDLKRTEEQESLLDESDSLRESYMLSYMLDVESNGSPSLLNLDTFEDPFSYKLKIATGSAGETKPVKVDLVETFNYLLGLTVHHVDHIRGFRVIQGTSPEGEKVLVIWRNLEEKSNEDLEEFFRKQEYNPKDMEFDLIYVNGDNNLENIRRPDETWKVRLIEEEFRRLMFEVEDI